MSEHESSVGTDRRLYYSSSQGPFHDVGNLLTFYGGAGRGAIVDVIIRQRRTLSRPVHVSGEKGSGRTFLSLVLADRLKHVCNVIRYEQAELSVTLLLRLLLIELCPREAHLIGAADVESGIDADICAHATRCILAQLARKPPGGKSYLLTVDVDKMPDIATIALLEQFAAVMRGPTAAMLIVLFRRDDATAGDSLREVARPSDTIQDRYRLRRLTLAETGEFLRHQMLLFDFNRRDLFTREMTYFVADRSEGIPGAINILARNAFTLASLEDNESPSLAHLLAAGLPIPEEPIPVSSFLSRHRAAVVALLGSCVVASSLVVVLLVG